MFLSDFHCLVDQLQKEAWNLPTFSRLGDRSTNESLLMPNQKEETYCILAAMI